MSANDEARLAEIPGGGAPTQASGVFRMRQTLNEKRGAE